MPTHFKLKFDDLTRRVSFAKQPNWQELSEKISTLYSIPQTQVGVIYIDAEDEEITLSTEEELQDYYFSSYRPEETIKFSVRDLSSRNHRQPAPASAGLRNTFGQFVDPEIPGIDEWQAVNNIPSLEEILGHAPSTSDVRSAFLESVVSEGGTVGKGEDNALKAEPAVESACSGVSELPISKGKERAHSMRSMSSTQSLLGADIGDKHPVHVYDVNSGNNQSPLFHTLPLDDARDPISTESTPRVPSSFLEQDALTPEKKVDQAQDIGDPPIPSLESTGPQLIPQAADNTQSAHASASLARDITSFLNAVANIVSSHPELGDSLRTIARNTTNGAYWVSHREALSQAAAEFQRNTENLAEDGRRVVEEEAGRRVAEALSGVLRIFSQTRADIEGQTQRFQPTDTTVDSNAQQADTLNTVPPSNPNLQAAETPHPPTPPMPGAFSSTDFGAGLNGSFPFGRRHTWRGGWRARASMPPHFGVGGSFPGWAMPPANPPFGPGVFNATRPTASYKTETAPFFHNAFTSASGLDSTSRPDQTNPEVPTSAEGHGRPSAQELKAKVEEAKRAYKAEKERYRREKDERKTEKDKQKAQQVEDPANTSHNTSQNTNVTASFQEDVHIATNARHGFPGFDIVNVTGNAPQRHNTHPGHFPRHHERPTEDLFTRATNRISKRLADMGFTEKAHPDLRQKIKNHLPGDGAIAKDSEDDIVTTLLEAMLSAPKSPVATGSGTRDIPGGWH